MDKIIASDKITSKKQKKREHGNKRSFYIKLYVNDYLEIEFTAC